LLRVLLRFDPCLTHGGLWLAPVIPEGFGDIMMRNIPLTGARISVEVVNGKTRVRDLPENVALHSEARKPLADLLDVHHVTSGSQRGY
jgi:hypothetical protein